MLTTLKPFGLISIPKAQKARLTPRLIAGHRKQKMFRLGNNLKAEKA